jgi:ubiquinol-cytochrome c reductase cytochrome c subunit
MRRLAALIAIAATVTPAAFAADGRTLFQQGCANCHGMRGNGVPGRGPSLRGSGAAAADFYLSTGRMPLEDSDAEPQRARPQYSREHIDALVAYVASLGAGPAIPTPDPNAGSVSEGMRLFADSCSGCHQIQAKGGVVTGGFSPSLQSASTKQIYEAVRVGPYVMPAFDEKHLSNEQLASIAKYVRSTRHPDDRGGWGISNTGPVPEGMVTWLLGAASLLVVARVIGKGRES